MNELTIENEIRELQLQKAKESSRDKQLEILANLLGYREMPVDIDTFMDDPYYMGKVSANLYPFWRKLLRELFPTPLHTSTPILVFTGAIGTGKSTCVRFIAEYLKYRLACLVNPYDTFKFVPGKNLKFSYFHKTNTLAQTDFVDVMDTWEEMSPFFKEAFEAGRLSFLEQVCDSTRSNNNIGSDVLFYNLSELNFINYESAHEKLDAALKRWSSRFEMLTNYFGFVIIDTSSQGDDSIADDFIKNNPYGDKVRSVFTNKWLVREHLNYYGQKGWFKIFTGDGTHQPFIVNPEAGRIITPDMDPDRVIDVPEECRADAQFDLITFLQDAAGISTSSTDRFFPDTTQLHKDFDLPQFGPDVVKFDFYDKTDKLIYRFDRSLNEIPPDKIIYVRYDIGVTGDNTGLAIAYFDKWKVYDANKIVRQPIIKVPLAVGINRYEGMETPIYHLFEFLMDLNQKFEIGRFSADQYASRQLLQDSTRENIPNRYLSVDRTDEAYVFTKTLANNGLLHLPDNHLLKSEFSELRRVGNKIDHPSTGCFRGDTEILVKTENGTVDIVKLEDLVDNSSEYIHLGYDIASRKFEWSEIKAVANTNLVTKLVNLRFSDGSSFYCTEDHLILTENGYIPAGLIVLEDTLILNRQFTSTSYLISSEIIYLDEPIKVYDLESTSDNHNFCLSNGLVVHNSKDIADAVAGAVFDLYQDIDKAGQLSVKYKVESHTKYMEDRSRKSDSQFQDMLRGIY